MFASRRSTSFDMHPSTTNTTVLDTSAEDANRSRKALDAKFLLANAIMFLVWVVVVPAVARFGFGFDVEWQSLLLAALSSALISVTTLFWSTGRFPKSFPVASVLLTVTWRLMATGGMAAISAATKWPHHKTFCFWLLGCYFSFFVLESAFSIARARFLSRR
jgi:hypothetical protein